MNREPSNLLKRIQAVRRAAPGVTLAESKRLVEAGADELFAYVVDLARAEVRRSDRAERRERIASGIFASLIGNAEFPWLMAEAKHAEGCVTAAGRLIDALDRRAVEESQS